MELDSHTVWTLVGCFIAFSAFVHTLPEVAGLLLVVVSPSVAVWCACLVVSVDEGLRAASTRGSPEMHSSSMPATEASPVRAVETMTARVAIVG